MQHIDITEIITKISQYQPLLLPATEVEAGVMLLLLINDQNKIEIPLTKRSLSLPDYAGHFSLPGGMRDTSDADLYHTAQRELHEELNIAENQYRYIGQLNDILTRHLQRVRPFVAMMDKSDFEHTYKIAADEISSIYFLSIDKFTAFRDDPKLHKLTKRRPSYVYREDETYVWGLTASILMHFYEIITQDLK